jgi:hypothetical protein
MTATAHDQAKDLCARSEIPTQFHELSIENPSQSWHEMIGTLNELIGSSSECLIDITTMPREAIWMCLNCLDKAGVQVNYFYSQPASYDPNWLSRDPGKPRIVYKLGGVAQFGLPTKLLVLTGFDLDRVKQLIEFFEPSTVLLGLQSGNQFENLSQNVKKYNDCFGTQTNFELFPIDAYSKDHGYEAVRRQILERLSDSNVVMSSLGPKLSSIPLYRLNREFEFTALSYTPSNEYNPEYSKGIGEMYFGRLPKLSAAD